MKFHIVIVLVALCLLGAKPKKTYKRAKPPTFDKQTLDLFEENAFATLGPKPKDFGKQVVIDEKDKDKDKEKELEEGNGDFDRREMMKKLQTAEDSLSETMKDAKTFVAGGEKISSSADLFIMMGRTLFSNDPDYKTDDDFLKQAEEMTNQAKKIKIYVKNGDYKEASKAFSNLKKSCNNCHEKFR